MFSGIILANDNVPMVPLFRYGELPPASRTTPLKEQPQFTHKAPLLLFPLLFLDNLPFLLQILNHCCQTVLSLKDMYSLLPGSHVCECLLSLVAITL